MGTERHTRYRRRYRGDIKRIRQRNRRVGIFLLVLFVVLAGVINVVKTKHQEAVAQAYAEQQAAKENQEAQSKEKEEENGLKLADESEKDQWYLKLVNSKNPMTQEDVPEVATETIDSNGYQVDARIMDDLEDMFAAARAAGRNPVICSAFRAWDTQEYLYQNKIQRVMAEEGLPEDQAAVEAGTVVACAGYQRAPDRSGSGYCIFGIYEPGREADGDRGSAVADGKLLEIWVYPPLSSG